jgi:hypothetical protein
LCKDAICQDIVKAGVNPQSDEYKKCQTFVLTGDYVANVRDWKSRRQRHFGFVGWKLTTIIIEDSAELDGTRGNLTKLYGTPVQKDSWRGGDGAEIRLYSTESARFGDENTKSVTVISFPKS